MFRGLQNDESYPRSKEYAKDNQKIECKSRRECRTGRTDRSNFGHKEYKKKQAVELMSHAILKGSRFEVVLITRRQISNIMVVVVIIAQVRRCIMN